jgi:hypothetical protein
MGGTVLSLIVQQIMYKEPNYSVAIAAVSGLDPATDLGRRPALDLEFNLTVIVAPRSPLIHTCTFPGTTMRVSYHDVELASAAAPKFCEERGTRTVIARGRTRLPGPKLDNLAADVQHSTGAFDITIRIPYEGNTRSGFFQMLVVSCTGRRIGEDVNGAALCDVRKETYARPAY